MRVLLVSNYNIEEGRGPMFRIMNMLSPLSRLCEIELCSFGPFDDYVKNYVIDNNITTHEVPYKSKGWFVKNKTEIAKEITNIINERKIDIVVLTWEIWDIAVALEKEKNNHYAEIAIVMHSIPFVGATIKDGNYYTTFFKRAILEKRWMIRKYLFSRILTVPKYIYKFNIITMNKTTEMKLKNYFKNIKLYLAYPGYSVEPHEIKKKVDYKYDFVFMAKFEYGKGIYEIIKIMREIKRKKPNFKLALVGSFTFPDEEKKFNSLIDKYGLSKNVDVKGWLEGSEKYNVISESKIFLYPSFSGDTFSICLLEALSCGKKIICYDVPFTKYNFDIDSVIRITLFNRKKFAEEALKSLIEDKNFVNYNAIDFVRKNYSSWDEVALSEFNCYREILQRGKVR